MRHETRTDAERVINAWEVFQESSGGLSLPRSEAEYAALVRLLEHLTERHDTTKEPYASLLGLVAGYLTWWEETRVAAQRLGRTLLMPEEAADLLNVSPKYLTQLAAEGKLACVETPEGPRFELVGVRAYKHVTSANRGVALRQLTRLSQELGMYDTD